MAGTTGAAPGEQPSHLAGSEVKGSAGHWPGYPDPCLCSSHLPAPRPQQTACSPWWVFPLLLFFLLLSYKLWLGIKARGLNESELLGCFSCQTPHERVFLDVQLLRRKRYVPLLICNISMFFTGDFWGICVEQQTHITVFNTVGHPAATLYLHNPQPPQSIFLWQEYQDWEVRI